MTLEATYICIDNSEYTRNGDFSPTRLQAIADACNVLCGAKTNANPENGVGFLTMGDDGVKIVETLTQELGRLLSSIMNLRPGGRLDLVKGLQVGQLGLKHRNSTQKNQRQRIVAFVASPLTASEKELVQLAKKLKKNSVCVDVVSVGCPENNEVLQAFVDAVNSKQQERDTSHLLVVNEGQSVADCLLSSPILNPDGNANASEGMFVDPNHDPELAMVLRMSLEEERARQEKARAESGAPDDSAAAAGSGGSAAPPAAGQPQGETEMTEDEELARALALSAQEASGQAGAAEPAPAPAKQEGGEVEMDEAEMTEEQLMEMALKMSMEEQQDPEIDALMEDADLNAQLQQELGIKKKDEEKKD